MQSTIIFNYDFKLILQIYKMVKISKWVFLVLNIVLKCYHVGGDNFFNNTSYF